MKDSTDGDSLLNRCCNAPYDLTARLVFADWLAEHDESDLEAAMRDEEKAVGILCLTWLTAEALNLQPSLRLLWSVALVLYPLESRGRLNGAKLNEIILPPPRALAPGELLCLPAAAFARVFSE